MKRTITIFFEDGKEESFEIERLYNPEIWTAYSVLHFTTSDGVRHSVRTADIERIEVEKC